MEDRRPSDGEHRMTRDDSSLSMNSPPTSSIMSRMQGRERSFSLGGSPPVPTEIDRRRSHTLSFPAIGISGPTTVSSPDIREREAEPLAEVPKERRLSQQLFGRGKPRQTSSTLTPLPSPSSKKKRLSSLLFGMNGDQGGTETETETEPERESDELSPWGEGLEVAKEANGTEYCKAGSLGKIVEYLLKKNNDRFAAEVLVIAYRQFVSPLTFFNILLLQYPLRRANGEEEKRATAEMDAELRKWLSLLELWIIKYLKRDFLENNDKGAKLFDYLLSYLKRLAKDGYAVEANQIKLLMIRTKAEQQKTRHRQMSAHLAANLGGGLQPHARRSSSARQRSSSIDLIRTVSYKEKRVKAFEDLAPIEVADEMTLIEFEMFKKIKEREFLNLSWKNVKDHKAARNIKRMVERVNKVSFWVATTIASSKELQQRVSLLKRFLVLAERCRELRNFNTLMEILGGLNMHPVARLKRTWAALPDKYRDLFHNLVELMENKQNYRQYRAVLASPPAEEFSGTLPYIGMYLRDLVFIEEGNNTITENGLINFEKLMMIGRLITEVQRFQKVNYKLEPCRSKTITKYLKEIDGESEARLDELSQQCEPSRADSTLSIPDPEGLSPDSSRGFLSRNS